MYGTTYTASGTNQYAGSSGVSGATQYTGAAAGGFSGATQYTGATAGGISGTTQYSGATAGGISGATQYVGSNAASYVTPSYTGATVASTPSYAAATPGYATSSAYTGATSYANTGAVSYGAGNATYGAGTTSYAAGNTSYGAGATSYGTGVSYGAGSTSYGTGMALGANGGVSYGGLASGTTSYATGDTGAFSGGGMGAGASSYPLGTAAATPGYSTSSGFAANSGALGGAALGFGGNSAGGALGFGGNSGGAALGFGGNSGAAASGLGGFNCAKFVFGADGPALEEPTAPAAPAYSEPSTCAYSVGQAVEVYSDTQTTWLPAKVTAVSADGIVNVKYGNAQKNIPTEMHTRYLRAAGPSPLPAMPTHTGRTYRVGETVDVFSKGEGAWVSARVTAVDVATGTVSVKWGERNQKDIAPAFFDEYLRPSAPADFQPKPKPPMTVAGGGLSDPDPYRVGETVEVYSRSNGGWVEALVQDVSLEGTVTVKWGPHMKKVEPANYADFLRHIVAPYPPPSMDLSGAPTCLGQLEPAADHGFNAPPTIPGGYSGSGMGMSSSPAGPAPLESTQSVVCPNQSGFDEIPPTNLGGMAPPTNFGGAPVASGGNLRYHDVPATIPGGYY